MISKIVPLNLHDNPSKTIIYPNPVIDELSILIQSGTLNSLEILDIKGQQIFFDDTFNSNLYKINVSDYGRGVYTVKLYYDARFIIQRVVIN